MDSGVGFFGRNENASKDSVHSKQSKYLQETVQTPAGSATVMFRQKCPAEQSCEASVSLGFTVG